MAGPNPTLSKTYLSGAAVGANKLVKMGAADEKVIEATDGSVPIIGVSLHATTGADQRIEVQVAGIATVKSGGAVGRTDYVTAGAAGVAVAAAPAAGVNSNVAGMNASKAAANGDLFEIRLSPHRLQG